MDTYEKKYKEALEVAKKLYQDCPNGKNDRLYHTTDLEKIFPELAESEDEVIRKEIISFIQDAIDEINLKVSGDYDDRDEDDIAHQNWCKKAIAWLEKQGDAEKKELKKIEDEEYNGEDYGIDSLWHAKNILEETLGKVDGYQTDDGILEHKCAITAVNKLYKQKPIETVKWSAQEEYCICELEAMVKEAWGKAENVHNDITIKKMQELMFFLKTLNPNKKPQLKHDWSEEDEKMIGRIRSIIEAYAFNQSAVDVNGDLCEKKFIDVDNWLKSIKDRAIPQPKQEWSEDDDWMKTKIIKVLLGCETFLTPEETIECVDFLKSIKDKYTWKPSDEQIEALGMATDICSIPEKYYDELSKLYFDLEKLKGE